MSEKSKLILFAAFVLVFAACVLLGVWLGACARASAFNQATGQHVTPWQALWLSLRVQAAPKE